VSAKHWAAWRSELVADLGGEDNISAQERTIVDLCVKHKVMLDSIDAWLLAQKSLVNMRKRALFPVVLQRNTLQDSLVRNLQVLGIKRIVKTVSLQDYVREKYGDSQDDDGQDDQSEDQA
jgi:hypothetical protein